MIKTLAKSIREYKIASVITPIFIVCEVILEVLIPYLMASLIDNGVDKGGLSHIGPSRNGDHCRFCNHTLSCAQRGSSISARIFSSRARIAFFCAPSSIWS